jgi:hypothetical protein
VSGHMAKVALQRLNAFGGGLQWRFPQYSLIAVDTPSQPMASTPFLGCQGDIARATPVKRSCAVREWLSVECIQPRRLKRSN